MSYDESPPDSEDDTARFIGIVSAIVTLFLFAPLVWGVGLVESIIYRFTSENTFYDGNNDGIAGFIFASRVIFEIATVLVLLASLAVVGFGLVGVALF